MVTVVNTSLNSQVMVAAQLFERVSQVLEDFSDGLLAQEARHVVQSAA